MHSIADNLRRTHARIAAAARACGRDPGEIGLVAVSKTKPVDAIAAAHAAGQRAFGENYLQEAEAKIRAFGRDNAEWHFIGRVQSNKTAAIAELFDWVHGLSSLKHAQRLSDRRPPERPALNCCIQVNLSGETAKAGIAPGDGVDLAAAIAPLPGLALRGLMTLPDPGQPSTVQQAQFRALRELRDAIEAALGTRLDTLSMGMSADLEAAIAEGATLVRIGTAIFGPRT